MASSRLTSAGGFWESSTFAGEEVSGPPQAALEVQYKASGRPASEKSRSRVRATSSSSRAGPFDLAFQTFEIALAWAPMEPVGACNVVDQIVFGPIPRPKVLDQLIEFTFEFLPIFPGKYQGPRAKPISQRSSNKTAPYLPPSPAPESEPR